MDEFDLINRFFHALPDPDHAERVALGIGDDCALLAPTARMQLAVSSDMLVEGRHFFPDVDAAALGHKALAVNLSDLAAMGAEPLGFTLALALPPERAADKSWLGAFSYGLLDLSRTHRCPLVGGDTTAGPLNICITVLGQVWATQALKRSRAQVGDDIWVSGTLGDARLALGVLRGEWSVPASTFDRALHRLQRPTPRLALGLALRHIAHSCIDISDGLAGDLGHILDASGVGAILHADVLATLLASSPKGSSLTDQGTNASPLNLVLFGGDDYELAFTAAAEKRGAVLSAAQLAQIQVTRIGHITAESGLWLLSEQGLKTAVSPHSFNHFK